MNIVWLVWEDVVTLKIQRENPQFYYIKWLTCDQKVKNVILQLTFSNSNTSKTARIGPIQLRMLEIIQLGEKTSWKGLIFL